VHGSSVLLGIYPSVKTFADGRTPEKMGLFYVCFLIVVHMFSSKFLQSKVNVMIFQILPLALRDCLDEEVRQAIIKVSRVFQRLCAREIKIADQDQDFTDAVESLCLMEKSFPPTFMDVMSHLIIHWLRNSTFVDLSIVDGCIQLSVI
jgi:hypothetical protein